MPARAYQKSNIAATALMPDRRYQKSNIAAAALMPARAYQKSRIAAKALMPARTYQKSRIAAVPLVYSFRRWDQASRCRQGFIHWLKWLGQGSNDGKWSYVKQQQLVGANHRSQQLSSLLHPGRTRTPSSDVQFFCSHLRMVKLKKALDKYTI